MPTYQIQAPNGKMYRIDGPDGASDAQVRAQVLKQYPEASGKPVKAKDMDVTAEAKRLKSVRDKAGTGGILDLLTHGATFGLTDEAAGVGNVLTNAIQAPFRSDVDFDPSKAYAAGSMSEKMRLADARKKTGALGTVGEIMAGVTSGGIGKAVTAAPTLLGRMARGARAAIPAGMLGGFGYGEGAEGKALSTVAGGLVGGAIGGAIPVVGQVVSNRAGGLRRMMGRDPELPRRLISEAMEADANTPRAVGQAMQDARTRGSPIMIADTGENARGLLASVSRKPGASRTIARDAVIARQEGQADRIGTAITRDLGPVSNPHQVADELMRQARTTAAPLYEQAYSTPVVSTPQLRTLLNRPSTRQGMARAYKIAEEEGRNPRELGFMIDDAGNVSLDPTILMGADEAGNLTMTQQPARAMQNSMQTLDYVKRGLDDVIESHRSELTGRLKLDEGLRAINSTQRAFIAELDRLNPAYAQARAAYGGPASGVTAMNKGLKALTKGADDISAQIANMTPYEQNMYRLGVRRAMSDHVAGKGDYADKVNALMGTPKKRQALERLFGGRGEFQNFINTLADERSAGLTYRSVATGSQTAERAAADELTGDTGLAESAMDAALRGGKDGIWSSLVSALQKLREVDRFGAGQAGEATRESIAALLTETDPAVLRDLMEAAVRAQNRQAGQVANSTQRAVRGGTQAGRLSGVAVGNLTAQPVEQ